MPYLRFNPYFALSAYSTIEDGPKFPFLEGEPVAMQLEFGPIFEVTEYERAQEYSKEINNPVLRAELYAEGKYIDGGHLGDCVLGEAQSLLEERRLHFLKIRIGPESILEAIITADDQEKQFPFDAGQRVIAPLVVARIIERRTIISGSPFWQALLSPLGDEIDGRIVTNVELAQE